MDWDIGETHTIVFGTKSVEVKITGFTRGEISRTVYFHRADLAEILDLEATVVMLQLPDGVDTDAALAASALGITMREDTLESFEKRNNKKPLRTGRCKDFNSRCIFLADFMKVGKIYLNS